MRPRFGASRHRSDQCRDHRVGWRVRDHHVEPGDAMLLHQAMRGAGGVVALACVVTAQHAEQACQAFAVGGCQRAHGGTTRSLRVGNLSPPVNCSMPGVGPAFVLDQQFKYGRHTADPFGHLGEKFCRCAWAEPVQVFDTTLEAGRDEGVETAMGRSRPGHLA